MCYFNAAPNWLHRCHAPLSFPVSSIDGWTCSNYRICCYLFLPAAMPSSSCPPLLTCAHHCQVVLCPHLAYASVIITSPLLCQCHFANNNSYLQRQCRLYNTSSHNANNIITAKAINRVCPHCANLDDSTGVINNNLHDNSGDGQGLFFVIVMPLFATTESATAIVSSLFLPHFQGEGSLLSLL